MIQIANSKSLDPTGKSLTVEAWVKSEKPTGVVLARGGPAQGYALIVQQGKPQFVVRVGEKVSTVIGPARIVNKWVHLAGVLTDDKELKLYVDGKLAATAKATGPLTSDPAQATEIGADDGGAVGDYASPFAFTGSIDEVRVYFRALNDIDVAARHAAKESDLDSDEALVLSLSFDNGKAADASEKTNNGKIAGAKPTEGKIAGAMQFAGGKAGAKKAPPAGSFVKRHWTTDVPLYARAMLLANKTLFVAGPPDIIDEEETFQKIMDRDSEVAKTLSDQDAALNGSKGSILLAVSASDGKTLAKYELKSLPVWDGMVAANGRLYLSTTDGKIVCFASSID